MIEAMQPPTYREVVERYGIEILELNHIAFYAMHRLIDGWRYHEPTLRFLFDRVFEVRHRHSELAATLLSGEIPSNRLSVSNRPGVFETPGAGFYFELSDAVAAHALGADAYAGAVILVLSGLLLAFNANIFNGPSIVRSEGVRRRQRMGGMERERPPHRGLVNWSDHYPFGEQVSPQRRVGERQGASQKRPVSLHQGSRGCARRPRRGKP